MNIKSRTIGGGTPAEPSVTLDQAPKDATKAGYPIKLTVVGEEGTFGVAELSVAEATQLMTHLAQSVWEAQTT